jgi:hypothetical protein
MGTKNEDQDVVVFSLRISRKQIRLMTILLTITFVTGVALYNSGLVVFFSFSRAVLSWEAKIPKY